MILETEFIPKNLNVNIRVKEVESSRAHIRGCNSSDVAAVSLDFSHLTP